MIIRQEEPSDYAAVYDLVKEAFAHAAHSDGTEHFLLDKLRNSTAFIPELSLVAEENGQIVGQIMFTKAQVGNTTQLVLAPIAVRRDCQGKGIGGKLITTAHKMAKTLGFEYSVLIGYPEYYARFGYSDAADFGIKAPIELPPHVFMAANVHGKNTKLNATIEFAKEFFENK